MRQSYREGKRSMRGEGGDQGGGINSMMKQRAEKCPPYTEKRTYEFLIAILCGDDETEVICDSIT